MAGNYPSPTARRINYDLNGTRVWTKTANATSTPLEERNVAFIENMNDESAGTVPVVTLAWNSGTNPGHRPFVLFKFPTPVDILGIKTYTGADIVPAVSNDTTDGVDGTWVNGVTVVSGGGVLKEWSRNGVITPQSFTGVHWLRLNLPMVNGNHQVGKVLLYGGPGAASDTLDFWDATLDQPAAPDLFEFGDRARGTSANREFRIKNLSETMRATDVSITRSIAIDTSPSVPGFHLFSIDGVTWLGNLDIGDLDPEEISPVITLRQTVPVNATLWLWEMTVSATPDGWETP